jgi:hypothetical protein
MAQFLVHVEFDDPLAYTLGIYHELHKALTKQGFQQVADATQADSSTTTTATFVHRGGYSLASTVRMRVTTVLNTIGLNSPFTVEEIQPTDMQARGLKNSAPRPIFSAPLTDSMIEA